MPEENSSIQTSNTSQIPDGSVNLLNTSQGTKPDPYKRRATFKNFIYLTLLTVGFYTLVAFRILSPRLLEFSPFVLVVIYVPYGVIAFRFLINFIGDHFHAHQISPEERQNLVRTTFPKYYHLVSFLIFAFAFGLAVASLFFMIGFVPTLQEKIYGSGALYFVNTWTKYLFALVFFFGAIILFGFVVFIISWFFSPKSFRDYLQEENMNGYKFDFIVTSLAALVIAVSYYLIVSPILYLSFKDYQAIFPNKIVANSFFDFKEHDYTFADLKNVTVNSTIINDARSPWVSIDLNLNFDDGNKVNFIDYQQWGSADEIKVLYKTMREKSIPIQIQPPSSESIQIAKTRCPESQRAFNAIFERDNPINPVSGCKLVIVK